MDSIRGLLGVGHEKALAIANVDGGFLSFEQLRTKVDQLAKDLLELGIGQGSRVAIAMPNGADMALVFLAVAAVGCAAPLNPKYREAEFRFFLDDLGAEALIVGEAGHTDAEAAAGAQISRIAARGTMDSLGFEPRTLRNQRGDAVVSSPPSPGDVGLALHTSGTTSRPKLVPLLQRNVAASATNIAGSLSLTTSDRSLNVMPLFHIHGLLAGLLAPLSAGASVVCTPGFDALRFHRWLGDWKPTFWSAVPTMHQLVAARTEGPVQNDLRFIRSSSAALPGSVLDDLEAKFAVPVVEAYGMTEASHQMTSNPLPPGVRKRGSVGLPTGIEVTILTVEGSPSGKGERGEVAVRGATIVDGYENNQEANAASFTAGGWFRTGDEGYLDEDGYLNLTGRLKEQINRAGEKVSPLEVDEVLSRHPSVAQAVTFAVPHRALGEEVAAAVVLLDGHQMDPAELRAFAAKELAAFKVPRNIYVVDEIPKGPTGKLQRIGLAETLGVWSGE